MGKGSGGWMWGRERNCIRQKSEWGGEGIGGMDWKGNWKVKGSGINEMKDPRLQYPDQTQCWTLGEMSRVDFL